MKKKLAVINSDSKEFSYGGVAPIMRNMHKYLSEVFDIEYYYLPDNWKMFPGLGRAKIMLYLYFHKKNISQSDFILSHIPEGSYVASFCGKVPYAHIYHGNTNPMEGSKYWFGKYFKFVFDKFHERIEKTASIKYTVGPVWEDKKKLYNPISHNITPVPYEQRKGFMFAGRLENMKNIDRLITIYSKLPQDIINKHPFYIAGIGTQEEKLKKLVKLLKLDNHIHFLGNLANQELIKVDSTKKILIMASSFEGLPTAIAEAFSVGVPVVSNCPGDISLVLKNDYNGFLLPMDFIDEDFIESIEKVLANYDKYAQNALKSSEVFNGEHITKDIINDIMKIANSNIGK